MRRRLINKNASLSTYSRLNTVAERTNVVGYTILGIISYLITLGGTSIGFIWSIVRLVHKLDGTTMLWWDVASPTIYGVGVSVVGFILILIITAIVAAKTS